MRSCSQGASTTECSTELSRSQAGRQQLYQMVRKDRASQSLRGPPALHVFNAQLLLPGKWVVQPHLHARPSTGVLSLHPHLQTPWGKKGANVCTGKWCNSIYSSIMAGMLLSYIKVVFSILWCDLKKHIQTIQRSLYVVSASIALIKTTLSSSGSSVAGSGYSICFWRIDRIC